MTTNRNSGKMNLSFGGSDEKIRTPFFDLDFYKGSEKVTYHYLSGRYRNTAGILQFINFVADNYRNITFFDCYIRHRLERDQFCK